MDPASELKLVSRGSLSAAAGPHTMNHESVYWERGWVALARLFQNAEQRIDVLQSTHNQAAHTAVQAILSCTEALFA